MNNIRAIREKALMTQADLALKTGFTGATINRVETGRVKSPHFFTRKKIAQALKVTVEELGFNRNGE